MNSPNKPGPTGPVGRSDSSGKPSFHTHPLINADPENGMIRGTAHCTNCGKDFITQLDGRLDGAHRVACPHCRHFHYRIVRNGLVTEERHTKKDGELEFDVPGRHVWKSAVVPIESSSASAFLRDRWFKPR